ncbi:MAG: hypothetical protein E7633_09680 [Ruminococcaceae bacterium]|nr:hypothetical protein [Oscillospiraceae bacterium]
MTKANKITISLIALLLSLVFILSSCSGVKEPDTDTDKTESDPQKDPFTGIFIEEEIPTINITTPNKKEVRTKVYHEATMQLELNERYADYMSTYTDEDGGGIQIRCRGNSTYGNADMKRKNKWAYKVKLDTKADMLGMGESRHWYLLANWFDVTAMRNKLAYDLSGSLGMSYTQSTWVRVYFNGEYRGLYSLVESITIGEGRVETFDWEEYAEDIADMYALKNDLSNSARTSLRDAMKKDLGWITTQKAKFKYSKETIGEDGQKIHTPVTEEVDLTGYFDPESLDITSGYLIEYDGRLDTTGAAWRTNNGIPVMLVNPENLHTNEKMYSYVKTLIQDFENAISSPTFYNSKGKHYSEYVDVDSLVDFWMIWTVFNNIEFGYLSLFYYIDDGKIVFGPCWDFDNASGNIVTLNETWERWDRWNGDRAGSNGWFKQLCSDPYFTSLCQEQWFSMREVIDDMMQSLDVYHYYISEEAIKCYERNGPRTNWYLKNRNGGKSYDFQTDFELLKDWLTNHIIWLDENLAVKDANIDNAGYTRSTKIHASASLNGTSLSKDNITSYGVAGDYIISPDATGTLKIKIINEHTTATSVSVYINGTKHLGKKSIGTKNAVVFEVQVSELDLTPGAVNVLYIPEFKSDGSLRALSSLLIRVYDVKNPSVTQAAVTFGSADNVIVETQGAVIKAPEITTVRPGFKALGWTTGDDKVYAPGEDYKVSKNEFLYIRWERIDMNSFMILED